MSEIKFRRDTQFRKQFFVPDSFAHPAKMDAQLLIWIVEYYTEKGETILDPMAGSGTTMLACMMGRNVVLVELEEKFCKMMAGYDCSGEVIGYRDKHTPEVEAGWVIDYLDGYYYSEPFATKEEAEQFAFGGGLAELERESIDKDQIEITYQEYEPARDEKIPFTECGKEKEHKPHHVAGNWEMVRMRPQLGYSMGDCQIIQGDARQLEGLLCDKIISSPPYSDSPTGGGLNIKPPRPGTKDQSGRSPDSPSQRGQVDKIVTSPPYAETSFDNIKPSEFYEKNPNIKYRQRRINLKSQMGNKGNSPENISNLPYGEIDKCIFSPPFGECQEGSGLAKNPPASFRGVLKSFTQKQGDDINNVGNLPYGQIDKIVTSPPYEHMLHGQDHDNPSQAIVERKKLPQQYADDIKDDRQIGNLKSQSYLEAMLQVYQQCYKVLKPQGLMILVTKNFIRNKQVVRLDEDTIKLCEQAGFSFLERHYRKLPSQSFWRVIYHQKHPEVEQINHEDVLIFNKGEK